MAETSYSKWRGLALFAGLAGPGAITALILTQRPLNFSAQLIGELGAVLVVTLVLGCWAAHGLDRSPVIWAFSIFLLGLPFLWLGIIGADMRGASPAARRRMFEAIRSGNQAEVRNTIGDGLPIDTILDGVRTPLIEAIYCGQDAIVNLLLELGAYPHARATTLETPLMAACAAGAAPVARLLVERGADVRAVGRLQATPLSLAIDSAKVDVVRVLLDAGLTSRETVGNSTALAYAAERGHADVQRLLQEYADAEAKRERAKSFFERFEPALKSGDADAVLKELEDVNLRAPDGKTALMIASRRAHLEAVRQLLDAGADPRLRDNSGRTALHAAVESNTAWMAAVLLQGGAEVDAADGNRDTPLLVACRNGRGDVVGVLLAHGANVKRRDRSGMSAIALAAKSGHWQIERHLLGAGAGADPVYDKMQEALLHRAAERGSEDELKWRLRNLSDADARARLGGDQALLTACRLENLTLARMLLRLGADPNVHDSDGASVLLVVARRGLEELERQLVAAGAVEDEAYQALVDARGRERENAKRRREVEDREAQELKREEEARAEALRLEEESARAEAAAARAEREAHLAQVRAVAGHLKCRRCAAGRKYFLTKSRAGGVPVLPPADYAGSCENCNDTFCTTHADGSRCPFCRGVLTK